MNGLHEVVRGAIPPAVTVRLGLLLFLVGLVGCAGTPVVASQSSADTSGGAVRVHYPAGFGHRITLHCSGDWNAPIATTWTDGDVWVATVPSGSTCKPLLDDRVWSIGPNYAASGGDIWPHFVHARGAYRRTELAGRGVWVYEPPSYDENPRQTYPVVYIHDGQNLFADSASFGGVSWNVGGAMDDGVEGGTIPEALVIGVENSAERIAEYTPVADPDYGGGNADAYLAFLIAQLKPAVDAQWRTQPDVAHTAIVGSSLGGLVSIYAGLRHADTFGLVGALSPSTWWDSTWIIDQSKAATPSIRRLYLDSGNAGPSGDDVTNTAALAAVWKTKSGVDVDYLVQDGASHNETYWRQRIPGALAFLLH
jgi:predicted alpha/beta superfamily hydrolase